MSKHSSRTSTPVQGWPLGSHNGRASPAASLSSVSSLSSSESDSSLDSGSDLNSHSTASLRQLIARDLQFAAGPSPSSPANHSIYAPSPLRPGSLHAAVRTTTGGGAASPAASDSARYHASSAGPGTPAGQHRHAPSPASNFLGGAGSPNDRSGGHAASKLTSPGNDCKTISCLPV